ncbi:MAG TPA: RNA polymerase sigma factor [Verrucomicrobiota bacterium]|jgi:RNA polymerase sigma-70 factor (ECF subfamily)|nr:RNA polymerase sigma factor [Verrucomicrobiota bacterium]
MRDYQDMVFTSALRLVGNEADAEDIAQDVFLKAYMHFDQLRHSFTVGGWLKTVTRNLSLNHLTRYRARWRFFSECDDHGESGEHHDFAANLPAPDLPTQAVDTADRRNLLESALQKLPPAQRVPLVLYHFENLSYEEIAAKLRISLGKVKTDIHRGRVALRQRLVRNPESATA